MKVKPRIQLLGLLLLAAVFTPQLNAQPNYPGQPPGRGRGVRCGSQNNRRN